MASEPIVGRLTPYEAVFGDERFERREFPAIVEEAESRNLSLDRRDEFILVARVGAVLQDLVPEDVDAGAYGPYIDTLFHAFHFWRAGRRIYALERAVALALVESPLEAPARLPPAAFPAFYLELPQRLFWGSVAEGRAPEPVEGMFVKLEVEAGGRAGGAEVLVVFGMRRGRAGFSAATLELEERDLGTPVTDAFRSEIPGAELAGLYSFDRRSEAVLFLRRTLEYLEEHPQSIQRVSGSERTRQESGEPAGRTALDHYRVQLIERIDP